MKICHYNDHEAGVVQDDRVYPIGQTLVGAGHLRQGFTMEEVINALANQPEAMQCVRQALKGGVGADICRYLRPEKDGRHANVPPPDLQQIEEHNKCSKGNEPN